MSYSTTICRSCGENAYVNLESSGYLCASCLRKINEPLTQKKDDDVVVKKSVRWLQSWLTIENLDTETIIVSWREPEFLSRYVPIIDSYYIFSECGRIQEIINGKLTQVMFEGIEQDSDYEISVNALVKGTPINVHLKKSFYNRKLL